MKLNDPKLEDLLEDLGIESVDPQDGVLARVGGGGPGVFLLNEAGRLIGSWTSGPPDDLREAFARAGWRPLWEELKGKLKDDPDRMDIRGRLVFNVWTRASRSPSPENLAVLAEELASFLSRPGWERAIPESLPLFRPPKPGRELHLLGNLAATRLSDVRDLLRQHPQSTAAWEMLSFLSAWHPIAEPRLYEFLRELEPPPGRFKERAEWPGEIPLELTERQLRVLKDWDGLERYAQHRLDLIQGMAMDLSKDLPAQWIRRLQPPPPEPPVTPPFGQQSARYMGKWLLLLLESQVKVGHTGAALSTISVILRDGDPQTQELARMFARRALGRADF
jgi:hypothetical protein